jgi:putative membrane-bound dehydrogenase-like protein
MKIRALLLLLALLAIADSSPAQVPPDKAVSTFTVADGLEISLWASEPLFVNPTCLDIDPQGRVWVCESVNYRSKLHGQPLKRAEGDRILILEDSKGTGKADKVTVFYQSPETLAPLGIAVARDPAGPGCKVFVCQSPDILVFEDKDGDGKADGPPKKLLTGFGGYDHDHGVHGILIGPDMKLYFSVGDQGVKDLQSADGKGRKWTSNGTDCRAGTIWRCNLDGTGLELIAHNFRNEYEPCVDSFGTVFVSDNDDDGNQQTRICYVMPGGNYGYHPRGPGQSHWHEEQPGVVPKILRTYFGSPTGMCVYEGNLLPEKYRNQPLHTDAGPRHVRCYHLSADGAGYAVDREDMVASTDNWFRPSDVCVAPDGSVYVADWYDPGVGGHGMGDTTRGRIFRIAPKGSQPSVPKVDLESPEGILAALGSPNLAVRSMAMAKIQGLTREEGERLLRPAVAQKDNPVLRARALWQMGLLHVTGSNFWLGAVWKDEDPRFRQLVIRIENDCFDRTPESFISLTNLDWRDEVVNDPSPAVRREALLALRDADAQKARRTILDLAKKYDGKDHFYLAAVGIAVGHFDKERRDVILAGFEKEFPEWNEKTAGLIWELRPPQVLPLLEKRITDATVPATQRKEVVDILAASEETKAGETLLRVLQTEQPQEVREAVLDNLKQFLPGKWRSLRQGNDLTAAVNRLLEQPQTHAAAMVLVAAAERSDLLDRVVAVARDTKEAAPARSAAVQTLGVLPSADAVAALEALLKTDQPALLLEVVQALGQQAQQKADRPGVAAALKALEDLVLGGEQDPAVRQAAVAALAGSRAGTQWLLEAHDKKQLPDTLDADAGRLLRNSPHQDLRNKALLAFPPPGKLDPKKLPSITVLAGRRGDAGHGKQLLAASLKSDLQCLKCHTVRGVGGNVGPDLSVIGKKASRENLLESILLPSKAIADQYLTWNVETKKGLTLQGLIVEETPDYVVLRDANAKDTKIDQKEIDTRSKSATSLMPADLVATMTEDELVDVVEYLFALKTPVLSPPSWHIAGPFDNGEADAGLDRVFPPEKQIDLKATYAGKAGPVGWRLVKPNNQGYVDLQAFLAPDSNNVVSYLFRDVESPADQEAQLFLGTDDCAKLWLNGELVYTNRQHRAAAPEQDTVRVRLKKGVNRVLLKINNGDGAHGFYLSIVAEQEMKPVEEK